MRGVEAVAADSGHAFPRHTHGQFGIGIVDRGAQRSFSGRGTVEAGAGDVITVNPFEVHDGTPIGDAGRAWRMLYLDPGVVAELATDLQPGHCGDAEFDRPVIHDADLAARMRPLFAQMTVPAAQSDALLREQLLLSVLADALHASNDRTNHHADAAPDAIQLARTRIDDDPAAAISLLDLAHETGLSRFQVLRGFARVTGLTPHAYQVQRRVALARRLIAQGQPLAEVAAACGFADQSHMTRQFVRKYGVSPGMVAAAR
ncbi:MULTISPECIES: AraC family transcriptional regulator [Ralstonia]|uniref:AraC family transcriptional regulator n=1 Tax=Ralstonia mojiangensis TaxID=2953895 RepID=A0AAE3LCR8_9RALS|nr:AraC family transcriptional regulator [Ralstonia mojiangensis]MCO5414242.1 AraC family transcriptional regulator [Ralstonia mojiangensis]MCT7318320.1 AraC family transcriptional regulator [Ralstonia mojiangensis]